MNLRQLFDESQSHVDTFQLNEKILRELKTNYKTGLSYRKSHLAVKLILSENIERIMNIQVYNSLDAELEKILTKTYFDSNKFVKLLDTTVRTY